MADLQLMPHQRIGGAFLASRPFALLADEPGLGKTATAIHGADLAQANKILVLCPAVVRPHWAMEFSRWQAIDRPVTVVEGLPKALPGPGVTIASHDALARSPDLLRRGAPYDLLIVDEFHAARDWNAGRTRLLCEPRETQSMSSKGHIETLPKGAWSWARQMWGLTGTPIVNSAADLWPIFYGPLQQTLPWYEFCRKFAERMIMSATGAEKPVGIKNASLLAEWLRPFTLRRTLRSVGIDLPSLSIGAAGLDLPPSALAEVMAGLENWSPSRLTLALEQNDDLKDANLMRMRRVLGTAKCLAVATWVWDRLVNHASGPVVVFFYHTDVRNKLYDMLHGQSGFRVGWIDGKITPKQLGQTEAAFQQGAFDVLLVQTQAGGQGITLHRSHTVAVAESPWTATAMQQAIKRIHRIGQIQPCTATILKANGCWMEEIMANIITKKHQASEILLDLLTTAN